MTCRLHRGFNCALLSPRGRGQVRGRLMNPYCLLPPEFCILGINTGGKTVSRLRVGVLFGGRSAEHEVSLRSAASVIAAMDRNKYEIVPIRIGRDGRWEIPSASSHSFLDGLAGEEAKTVALLADPTSPDLLEYETSQKAWRSSGRRVRRFFPRHSWDLRRGRYASRNARVGWCCFRRRRRRGLGGLHGQSLYEVDPS